MSRTNDEKSITIGPDLVDVFPLPVRVVPEPWEDLASLLSRTAEHMGYMKVHWLLRPEDCAYRRLEPDVCFLLQGVDFQYLGLLLQLSEEALYKLTLHRFLLQMLAPEELQAASSGHPGRPLFPRWGHAVLKLFQSKPATRVCPVCLDEEPACGLLYWNFGPIVSCLKHQIFLIDCCPHCQGKIPRLRSVLTHCPRCNRDYRLAPTFNLPEDPLLLSSQAMSLAHLGVEEEYRGGVPTVYGESPLHGLLSWQYFKLLKSFRNVLGSFFPNHPLLRTVAGAPILSGRRTSSSPLLSLGEWASFVLTFRTLFTSWPDNFITLLECIASMRSRTSDMRKGPGDQFGNLYDRYLYNRLRDPAFAFLREAFENYLKKHYTRGRVSNALRPFIGMDKMEIATQCTYLTVDQAMQLLGVHEHNLNALISRGVIRGTKKPIGKKGKFCLWQIEKVDVLALLEEWRDLLSIDDVARMCLGISKQQVLALTKANILLPSRGPNIDRCHTWFYKPEEIESFKARLIHYADKVVPPVSRYVPLSKSPRSIGLPLVESLKEILDGRLILIDTEREIPIFQRFVLSENEVKRFLQDRLKAERSDLNLLSVRDVAKILDVAEDTLRVWVRKGVLVGRYQMVNGMIHGLFFQREIVDVFRRTYVLAKEAAEILDVHPNTIYKYVARGILHPIGLPRPQLFLREEVEAPIPPDTLSIPQAAALLDMSVSALYARVEAGYIPYVQLAQCPKNKWLLYSEVERFQDRAKRSKSRLEE